MKVISNSHSQSFYFKFANCNCVHWIVILHPTTLQNIYQSMALAVTLLSDRNMCCLCKYAYSNMLRFLLLKKKQWNKTQPTTTKTQNQNGQMQLEEKGFISAYNSWVTIHCHWQQSRQELKEQPAGKNWSKGLGGTQLSGWLLTIYSFLLHIQLRKTCLGVVPLFIGWAQSHHLLILKIVLHIVCMEAFSQFTSSLQIFLVHAKLRKKN